MAVTETVHEMKIGHCDVLSLTINKDNSREIAQGGNSYMRKQVELPYKE